MHRRGWAHTRSAGTTCPTRTRYPSPPHVRSRAHQARPPRPGPRCRRPRAGLDPRCRFSFIRAAIVGRAKWKCRERAYRYIYLQATSGRTFTSRKTSLGPGICAIGAFLGDRVNGIVGVDGLEETVIYMATVGWRRCEPPPRSACRQLPDHPFPHGIFQTAAAVSDRRRGRSFRNCFAFPSQIILGNFPSVKRTGNTSGCNS